MNLIEKPLIVMETSLLHSKYLGLSMEQAQIVIFDLMEKCKKYYGTFSILWHNSYFENGESILYKNILEKGFELKNK